MTKREFKEITSAFAQKHNNHPIYSVFVEDNYISFTLRENVKGCFPQPFIYYDQKKRRAIEPDRSLYKSKDLIFKNPEQLKTALESYVAI